MHLTVFGATGGTGREVVRQALAAGHDVTAVVRAGSALGGLGADVITADVTDPSAIALAVGGADAVISALGPRGNGPSAILSDGTRAVATAMEAAGVKRLAVTSMAPVTTAGDGPVIAHVAKPLLRRFLRHALADSIRMEQFLQTTDLDWTVVRPPYLTNGRQSGKLRTAYGENVRRGFSISRADLAAAILELVSDPAASRCAVGVAR